MIGSALYHTSFSFRRNFSLPGITGCSSRPLIQRDRKGPSWMGPAPAPVVESAEIAWKTRLEAPAWVFTLEYRLAICKPNRTKRKSA
jgi:hypothetical protein